MRTITTFDNKDRNQIYFEYDRETDTVLIKTTQDDTTATIANASEDLASVTIRFISDYTDEGVPIYDYWNDLANNSKFISGVRTINGTDGDESIKGSAWNDTIVAGAGNDTITANRATNVVDAGDGDDVISVTSGTVTGGKGNDTITISSQFSPWDQTPSTTPTNTKPVVINFNAGDGADTIINNFRYVNGTTAQQTANSTINFGVGITKEDLKLQQVGNDLVIFVGTSGDKITLQDYFSSVQLDGKPYLDTTVVDYYLSFNNGDKLHITGDKIINANNPNEVFPLDKFLNFGNTIDSSSATKGQRITGTDSHDTITGGAGNDVIKDTVGHNYIDAGAGNDNITGTGTIKGGAGNDVINIKESNSIDTIIFGMGDGKDVVNSYDDLLARDTLRFGPGVTKADLSFKRTGNDLIILLGTSGADQLTLKNYFKGPEYQTITKFEFTDANGHIIADQTVDDLREALNNGYVLNFQGTAKNDNIMGSLWNDSITAGAGNDKITGAGTIIGGTGNDVINIQTTGSADTIVFNKGDGKDVINSFDTLKTTDTLRFGAGITAADLQYSRKGNNLVILVGTSGDQITLNNFFKGAEYQTLHKIEFVDGDGNLTSTINDFRESVTPFLGNASKGNTINGSGLVSSAGNGIDSLTGGAKNDHITGAGTIIGGAGNDVINIKTTGSADTIVFNVGDGKDVVNSYDTLKTTDTLKIVGDGISASDLKYIRKGNNLVIQVGASANDQITLNNFFKGAEYQTLHQIEFVNSSGNVTNSIADFRDETLSLIGDPTRGSTLTGTGLVNQFGVGSDSIVGGVKNDKLTGAGTMDGGKGNDVINIKVNGSADTIHYKLGDGKDVINSLDKAQNRGADTLIFDDIASTDVTYERKGNHLILKAPNGGQITINNYFAGADYQTIKMIQFTDGYWQLNPYGGNSGFVQAGGGATLPSVPTTSTADLFTFTVGDGNKVFSHYDAYLTQDTLRLEGVTSDDVAYQRKGNNLVVFVKSSGEEITLKNYFVNPAYQTINKFVFDDGDINDIRQGPINLDYSNTIKGQTIKGNTIDQNGTLWSNQLTGGSGNDNITGAGTITGGKGNDVINIKTEGSADTIVFHTGDGKDVINSFDASKTTDTLQLDSSILPTDLTYTRKGNNLIIEVGYLGNSQITINNFFKGDEYQTLHKIEFVDAQGNVVSTINDLRDQTIGLTGNSAKANTLTGTGLVNSVTGHGSDRIVGGNKNDHITGAGTIIGGKGNDVINIKSEGSIDTIIYNKGDGNDVINSYDKAKSQDTLELHDIALSDVSFTRSPQTWVYYGDWAELKQTYDLIITINSTGEKITVKNYFKGEEYRTISNIVFKDDTGVITGNLDFTNPNTHFTFEGSDKNDRLVGSLMAGKDYIDAKGGNDNIFGAGTIIGGQGNDTINIRTDGASDEIHFNLGDGKDVINSLDKATIKGQDSIVFGDDVNVDNVLVSRKGNNLILTVGSNGDQITITNYFKGADYQTITQLKFSDGSYWDLNPKGGEHGLVTKHNVATTMPRVAPFSTASVSNQTNLLLDAMAAFAPPAASEHGLVEDKSLDHNNTLIAVDGH